ncbi:MAG: C-type lectin domain-containing protein [Verrucomicrobiae bacterium]|nr:C-type lectin domain-containing protein [Verrucomicrobiae bacterium]
MKLPIFVFLLALLGSFTSRSLADAPISTTDLAALIASGQFREAVARINVIPPDARPTDPRWRFLADAARDFALMARAEAIGTGRFPEGVRIKVFGGSYYGLLPIDTDLEEAKAIAASFGGRLVEIQSEEEQRFVTEQILLPTAGAVGGVMGAWTGIENGSPGEKDSWRLSDGSPIVYASWKEGEPDGNNGESVVVALFSDQNGRWLDASPGRFNNANGMKCPLIQWMTLPSSGEETVSLAEAATAPILAMAALPSFDDLQGKAVDAIEKQCLIESELAFGGLVEGYRRALASAEKDATTKGELEEVVAIRSEARLAESWKTLAEGAEISPVPPHPVLADLRSKLVQSVAGLLAKRSETMAPLIATYRDALGAIEKELTVAYRIDDALAIRGLRNELAVLIGEEAQVVSRPLSAVEKKPTGPPKYELQLDVPKRDWPVRSYNPGKPGKLGGFGTVWPGDVPLDLSRAEGITDFVRVALLDDGWVALRLDGTLVSTRDKLNGLSGIWRMIPRAEDGVLLFRDDDTMTVNDGGPIRDGNGIPIAAREIAWASHCNGAGIATMKDGRVHVWGDGFIKEERAAIEKAFTSVMIHSAYRYGVWGFKPDGGVVAAVLADADRLKKEGGVRLPEVAEPLRGISLIDLRGAGDIPWLLTDDGDLMSPQGGWFPKKVSAAPFGPKIDSRAIKGIIGVWNGDRVKVSLTKTGRWNVIDFFELDKGRFARELESRLQGRGTPLKDLAFRAREDKGNWMAAAVWIE